MIDRRAAFETKLERLRAWMRTADFGALVLTRLENVFWLGCGADGHIPLINETALCALVVTSDQVTVVTDTIEAPRLRDEEFGELGVEVQAVAWHDGDREAAIAALVNADGRVGSDVGGPAREQVDLSPLRYSLTPHEVELYRRLGADMGAVLGATAATFARGESEFAVAGRLAAALLERQITPVVLLVAGDERVEKYRHPLPTAATIDRLGMLVTCGRRAGLIVSVTRLAHFGPLPAELRRRHEAVCRVDASFISHTVPGSPASAVFSAGVAAYAAEGFADEWRLHHQGGACGYLARDYKATFDTHQTVEPWQAFAWNPSITGTKSEDTMLATPHGPEIVSGSPDWPLLPCEAAGRTLARAAILER